MLSGTIVLKSQRNKLCSTKTVAVELFNELYENRDDNFGNGRDVRNIFEKAVARHSDRVAAMEAPTREDLLTLIEADLHPEAE